MACSSSTSTPPTDSLFHSDPPHSAPHPACSPRLPAARPSGAFVGGSVPLSASGAPHTDCRLVEVHGVKVASFTVDGAELVCLPQVFELFLKQLVGGLHTVYTKLKRRDVSPLVCTVEQVRVLRGLGAIQPGVNRCKLISRADFETLYRDCTSASFRPGRPAKRTLGVAMMTGGSRLLPHCMISPALLSQTGGSEASWHPLLAPPSSAAAPPPGSVSLNVLQQHSALLASRLAMPNPLLPVSLPLASVAMVINQMSQLSGLANMAAVSETRQVFPSRSPSPSDDELHPREPTSQSPSRASSSSSSSPPPSRDEVLLPRPLKPTYENLTNAALAPLLAEGLSSMELLLTNIQGLLKVALQSVRAQVTQNQTERKELKLELEKERDARQMLQRQLTSELQTRVSILRRLKKEKKVKRRLQEGLDFESRRREEAQRALKHPDSFTDAETPKSEVENSAARENRPFIKPPLLL